MKRDQEKHDADGHSQASPITYSDYRLSARFNRHDRREVSVSNSDATKPIDEAILEQLSLAHITICGAPLEVAYTEPRNWRPVEGGELYWAVLHATAEDAQTRIM